MPLGTINVPSKHVILCLVNCSYQLFVRKTATPLANVVNLFRNDR